MAMKKSVEIYSNPDGSQHLASWLGGEIRGALADSYTADTEKRKLPIANGRMPESTIAVEPRIPTSKQGMAGPSGPKSERRAGQQ